jgi:hypothetical protein
MLTKEPSFEKRLHVSASIDNAVNHDFEPAHFIDNTVGLEMYFSEVGYANAVQFGWNVSA